MNRKNFIKSIGIAFATPLVFKTIKPYWGTNRTVYKTSAMRPTELFGFPLSGIYLTRFCAGLFDVKRRMFETDNKLRDRTMDNIVNKHMSQKEWLSRNGDKLYRDVHASELIY